MLYLWKKSYSPKLVYSIISWRILFESSYDAPVNIVPLLTEIISNKRIQNANNYQLHFTKCSSTDNLNQCEVIRFHTKATDVVGDWIICEQVKNIDEFYEYHHNWFKSWIFSTGNCDDTLPITPPCIFKFDWTITSTI